MCSSSAAGGALAQSSNGWVTIPPPEPSLLHHRVDHSDRQKWITLSPPPKAQEGIGRWIRFYNLRRPHQALDNRTPMEVYRGLYVVTKEAA